MSSCGYYEELASRMLDGDLTSAEEAELLEHIRICPHCEARFRAFQAVRAALEETVVDAPDVLTRAVMDAVHAQPRKPSTASAARSKRRPVWRRMAVAACLAVVLGSGAWMAIQSGVLRMDRTKAQAVPSPTISPAVEPSVETEEQNPVETPPLKAADRRASAATADGDTYGRIAAAPAVPGETAPPSQGEAVPAPEEGATAATPGENTAVTTGVTADVGGDLDETVYTREPETPPQPLPETPPRPMPDQTLPDRQTQESVMMDEQTMPVAIADGASVVSGEPDAPAPAVYGPDGQYLGVVSDLEALDALLTESDPVPSNLSDIQWNIICSVAYGEDVYTFAADDNEDHLIWWTESEPAMVLSPGTADDLRALID